MVSQGMRISVIPRVGVLYRVRAGSMVRTYDERAGLDRIAEARTGLPRFEGYRLQALAFAYRQERQQHAALRADVERPLWRRAGSVLKRRLRRLVRAHTPKAGPSP
jgi:hypothetical protein